MSPSSTSEASPTIAMRDIGKTFANGVTALAGFSLDVKEGEFLSLLGPSGCGKSTVLRMIAGLTAPTRGQLTHAAPRTDREGRALDFVFQEPTLMPWATVYENVALPLKIANLSPAEVRPRVDEAIARVGLAAFAGAYPRELSGGMKMRVSIARAIVDRPRILLMDEPFAALDEITRFKLNNDLLELWQSLRVTVVFVTHSVFESVYLSSRIVVMTPRPGRAFAELSFDTPYPRPTGFRTSADYAANCRVTTEALYNAMGSAAA
jgi:NitT/TauT family transport system ATP-binding protein